ncbi:MAG: type I methionyl aminopeptidase [Clostridiales bacterium]|nr:type I methionyl aminopeptidase [Clostridiales bacterium]
MIKIKSQEEIELMRIACRITRDTLKVVENSIKVGVSTKELDEIAYKYIISQGATPSFKNYCGFPASICASINDTVVHGIPNKNIILKEGDIISIDVGAKYKGYNGDAARTFPVGKIDSKTKRLIKITEQSFFEGIKGLKSGAYVGDISHRVQTFVEKNGYSVVRELVGHGVGKDLHEDPNVPNFGRAGSGPRLTANMIIAIEPMVNMGERNVIFLPDGWTCKTRDGMPSAHYENTVLITEEGVEILTL